MSSKNKDLKPIKQINEMHKAVINEYYNNGFNGVKAVLSVNPGLAYGTAGAMSNTILNKKENKPYIEELQTQLKASANVETENILKELLIYAYSDVTDFIGLSLEEIKNLPPEIRRCLQGLKIKTKKYKNREGKQITEEQIEFKLIDKLNAIDKINKYIGFYEADNKQKAPKIDLTQINTDKLNVLLELHQQIKNE
jgi:hypothetical protein